MPHQINQEKCVNCKSCIQACPVGAITVINSLVKINADECVDCQTCWRICPDNAIDGGPCKYLELRAK